jgi:SAM-dependent methyltransferase
MTRRTAAQFFDAIAGRYDRTYAPAAEETRRRMPHVLRALPAPPARVLDLGVGTGRELSALLDAGYAPTGLDASGAMLERCARRARPVPLVLADFWQPLPFPTSAFDAAVALHGTLAHPPDREAIGRLSREVARVVRAGGVWIVEMPSPAWLDQLGAEGRGRVTGDGYVTRSGPRTCVYEDRVVGASIETYLPDEGEWRAALGSAWTTRVQPHGECEWLVVAERAR